MYLNLSDNTVTKRSDFDFLSLHKSRYLHMKIPASAPLSDNAMRS